MKRFENDALTVYYNDSTIAPASLVKFSALIKDHPVVLRPFRGGNETIGNLCSEAGFHLYSTVRNTTLLFDPYTNCFFKILHPLTLKNRVLFLLKNRAESVFITSEHLSSQGIKITGVKAYGTIREGGLPFFITLRAEGESLYEAAIKKTQRLPRDIYLKVLDEVVKLHKLGYWFSDAHLSHIFIQYPEITGIIDIDGIRKNRPFLLKNLAKDLAGLNHPGLPLTGEERESLLNYYLKAMGLNNKEKFVRLLNRYTVRRWKD